MSTASFIVEPLDVLFFRDARPLGPGHEASSGLPMPQTLAGALRTALLRAFGFDLAWFAARRWRSEESDRDLLAALGAPASVLSAQFRGPFLVQRERGREDWVPWLPAPKNIVRRGQKLAVIKPVERSRADEFVARHARLPGGLRPVWLHDDTDAEALGNSFLSLQGLHRYLEGGVPECEHLRNPDELLTVERRTSVGIDDERRASADGLLFTNAYLSLRNDARVETAFLVEVEAEDSVLRQLDGLIVRLGGEGRCAAVRRLARAPGGPVASWSRPANAERAIIVLLTAVDLGPSMLPALGAAEVVSVASGRPLGWSGFDVARGGPRPTRWLTPAGSVFFVQGRPPDGGTLAASNEGRAIGEGLFVTGAWKE